MKIEVGQWYRSNINKIVKCVHIDYTKQYNKYVLVFPDGSCGFHLEASIIEHLPDCDSFTWEPPKPKLQLREGAWYKRGNRQVVGPCKPSRDRDDRPWSVGGVYYTDEGTNSMESPAWLVEEVPDPTPKPVYRPFTDGVEFAPHRDMWITEVFSGRRLRITLYDNLGIWHDGSNTRIDWKTAYEDFVFDNADKTPFGVHVDV